MPYGAACDGSGNIYVADSENNRIQKFDSSGKFISGWGLYGGGDAQFSKPRGVAVGAGGAVYISDTYNNRVQKFVP